MNGNSSIRCGCCIKTNNLKVITLIMKPNKGIFKKNNAISLGKHERNNPKRIQIFGLIWRSGAVALLWRVGFCGLRRCCR